MMGFSDFWIFLVYFLCIASSLLCIIYGALNWNKGADDEPEQIKEESEWEKGEVELEKEIGER